METSQFNQVGQLGALLCYVGLALVALWGVYCVVMVWRRVALARFRSEQEQSEFLEHVTGLLALGDFDEASRFCEQDPRAVPQLALVAIKQRGLEPAKLRHLLADRFGRDVLADLEYRISWINTVVRTAPMLGLFGTVLGMMSAFGRLGGDGDKVNATGLADDISLALVTTALGLAIAIPLTLAVASMNIRIRKMEDLVGVGLGQLFDTLKETGSIGPGA